jgi:membrane protease YdiL (CAAX protease family)
MFIEQAFKPENKFWKYIVGSVLVIIASFIGQIPFTVAVTAKVMQEGVPMPKTEAGMMNLLDLNLTFFLVLLSFAVGMLGLALVLKNYHNQKFKDVVTSRPKVDWSRILFSFTIWAIFSTATVVIGYYASPEDYVMQFDFPKFAVLFVIAIIMVPIQTSLEELLFRGYLMQGFGRLAKNRWFPLVMTSLIFGALHLANPEVTKMGYVISIYYIGTGLFLGIMTLMDEGTELALGFHAANNLTAALLVTADWTAFQTNSVFKDVSEHSVGFEIITPVVIIFPIILFIFSKKYKWTHWKEKLTGDIVPPANTIINEIGTYHD